MDLSTNIKKETYPSPRRLGQQHQSGKSWQKAGRHARKAIKHARKAIKHARKLKHARTRKYSILLSKRKLGRAIKKRGLDCS